VGVDEFHGSLELREAQPAFDRRGGERDGGVALQEAGVEAEGEEVGVEGAEGPAVSGFVAHLCEELAESAVVEGPVALEGRCGWGFEMLGEVGQAGVSDGEDEALGGSLPAEAVAGAGRDEDEGAGLGAFYGVAAARPPLEVGVSAELEMEAEVGVLVLGDFAGVDLVALEEDACPGLSCGDVVRGGGEQGDEMLVADDGDTAGGGLDGVRGVGLAQTVFSAGVAYRAGACTLMMAYREADGSGRGGLWARGGEAWFEMA
jgi:hypothetical protein